MREHLAEVAGDVAAIREEVNSLAVQQIKAAGDKAKGLTDKWSDVLAQLRQTEEYLQRLAAVYGLDPAEAAALKAVLADKLTELGSPPKEKAAPKDKTPPEEKTAPKPPEGQSKPPPAKPDR